eukprot:CAMPEP_0206538834 /NCGR_PEP_ID=MMETSP0325_2-20121206/8101_1 /ASSEMBLY_ACC=CAM_ASM_000347 /TAXON_ID=2866 /ORGANISM="Crypthecodinium cohnii, Strain Seligo" /LENGTH=48 /DNA_ID= /DNA_START= /DNA_END= /DNA_ORIENTATION=
MNISKLTLAHTFAVSGAALQTALAASCPGLPRDFSAKCLKTALLGCSI